MSFDVDQVRGHFPILGEFGHDEAGRPLVYLDSAATSLKPDCVIDRVTEYYSRYTANVGRGIHRLSQLATAQFEAARQSVAQFIGARASEIAFTHNTTDAINLVSYSYIDREPVLYALNEHHSNLLPWTRIDPHLKCRTDAVGRIDLHHLQAQLEEHRPSLFAVSHVSNTLGVIQPIAEIAELCQRYGTHLLVDGSQSVPHGLSDVSQIGCDYLCFSGHKMCGPTGVGVLFGRSERLAALQPLRLGGGMVKSVAADSYQLEDSPRHLEAGTPAIEGVLGLEAACQFLARIGLEQIEHHVDRLLNHLLQSLGSVPGIQCLGPVETTQRCGSVAFAMNDFDAHVMAQVLSDQFNICVRSGYHCAEPAHQLAGIGPSLRASLYLYNTLDEVDQFVAALQAIKN